MYFTNKVMSTLKIDQDGYVGVEEWCLDQNVSVKSMYILLKKKKLSPP